MLVTRCVECNHEELSVNSGCLCACHVRVESARTPAERIAELEARLAMVVEVCSTQRSALMDLLAALEFEFTAMSRAKLLPRGDELNHHFAHFLSRVKDLDITPAEPTVTAFIARVEARGAARAREAAMHFLGCVLAVRLRNQAEFMSGLADDINVFAEAMGDNDRAVFSGDGFRIVKAARATELKGA